AKLFEAQKLYEEKQKAFQPPKPEPELPKDPKDKKAKIDEVKKAEKAPALVPTGDVDADYAESLASLRTVIKDFPKTQAAVYAAIDLGSVYVKNKKFDKAIQELEPASKVVSHPVPKAFVLDYLGLAY